MKITNNSIIDTVIEYANVKFGMEVKQEDISKQLKQLSYKDTLQLVDAITSEDDEAFSDIIDLSAVSEAYGTAATGNPSRATNRKTNQDAANATRRADNINMKGARAPLGPRSVAGGNRLTGPVVMLMLLDKILMMYNVDKIHKQQIKHNNKQTKTHRKLSD